MIIADPDYNPDPTDPDEDVESPAITLEGLAFIEIPKGQSFTDPGATCTDNIDCTVIASGSVNTSIPGEYTIEYFAMDPSGNISDTIIRTIRITDTTVPPRQSCTLPW